MWDKEALDKAGYIIKDLDLDIKPAELLEKITAGEMAIPDAYEELLNESYLVTKKMDGQEVVLGTVFAFSGEDAKNKLGGETSYLLG